MGTGETLPPSCPAPGRHPLHRGGQDHTRSWSHGVSLFRSGQRAPQWHTSPGGASGEGQPPAACASAGLCPPSKVRVLDGMRSPVYRAGLPPHALQGKGPLRSAFISLVRRGASWGSASHPRDTVGLAPQLKHMAHQSGVPNTLPGVQSRLHRRRGAVPTSRDS